MPTDFKKTAITILKEKRPDIDVRDTSPIVDLLVSPFLLLATPLRDDIDALRKVQSVIDPASVPEEDFAALMANLFVDRDIGSKAQVMARVSFDVAQSITINATDAFSTGSGLRFFPNKDYVFPEGVVRLNVDGGLFYVDVPVLAENPGAIYRIGADEIITLDADFAFIRVTNPFPASAGGHDRETNVQLATRARNEVTVRDLVTGKGIKSVLQRNFPFIDRIQVVGYLDPEMQRDLINNVHIGGQVDVYVRTSSLKAEAVKVTTMLPDGGFALHTGEGATRRPVIRFDSVRTLNAALVPVGPTLRREEDELIKLTPLHATGTFTKSSMALNKALGQMHVVSVEEVDHKVYLSYQRLDIFGQPIIAPVRLTDGSLAIDHPFIAASGSRVFIFYGVGGGINLQVLDATASTLTKIKDNTVLAGGAMPLQPHLDAAIDVNGNCHLTFSRTSETPLGPKELVWYAQIKPDGTTPPALPPKQAAFDVPGFNTAPSIAVTNTPAVKVTIAFTAKLVNSANIYLVQLDFAGNPVGATKNLTNNSRINEQPAITADSQTNLHVFWVDGTTRLRYVKLNNTLGTLFPATPIMTRPQPIKELRVDVNLYGFLYPYWVEATDDFTEVISIKCSGTDGRRIGSPQNLTKTPYFSRRPTLRTDGSGDIHLVWEDGIRGTNKPFYVKRSPQEYHVRVVDPNYRYSVKEKVEVVPELPAAFGIQVDLRWADQLKAVQDFVLSDRERVATAGLLVRHFLPATASMDVRFGPSDGPLSEAAAVELLQDFIATLSDSVVEPSALVELLFRNGARGVSPIEVHIAWDDIDGSIKRLRERDTAKPPRVVNVVPGTITAKFK